MDVARLLPVFAPPMALERLADAVCLFHAAQFDELLRTLMLRACAQIPTVDSLRQILCDLVYTIMQRYPAFVPAISHAKLTEDDILRRIRAAQDAGQLAGGGGDAAHAPAHDGSLPQNRRPGRDAH